MSHVAAWTFLLFVAATLFITAWAARRTRSREDFYAAGSRITWTQNGLAIFGDAMSAAAFLGLTGLFFLVGYDGLYFSLGLVLGWAMMLLLIAERLRGLGSYTFADVLAARLEQVPIRKLAVFITLAAAVPYLIAQMVAAGALVEALFGLTYTQGVLIVGVLMTIYVTAGGMMATTWVQIVKAALLLFGASVLTLGVLLEFGGSPGTLFGAALDAHPSGSALFRPGGLYSDPLSGAAVLVSLSAGTVGLPHVLMRFFTVPDPVQARRSAMLALGLVGALQVMVLIMGLGGAALLVGHPEYSKGGTSLVGGDNMTAIHLAHFIGGPAFMGFMAAVTFATILAVVSGLTISAAAAVSHDFYSQVICRGRSDERRELVLSRVTALALGTIAVLLSIRFQGVNVGLLAVLPMAIAASSSFPLLILAMYWKGLTTRGALAGGYGGLVASVVLIILGPYVWVQFLGFEKPVFPYAYPTLFSMPLAFFLAVWFSRGEKEGSRQQ